MASKKSAASKRANLPRVSDYTREFQKYWVRLSHSGRYDMNRLKNFMLLLVANNGPLPPEWLDHPLMGEWAGHSEYHIGGDFLLFYRLDDSGKSGLVVLCAVGLAPSCFLSYILYLIRAWQKIT